MAKIMVHRTYIAINDYNLGDKVYLEHYLSTYDKAYFRYNPIGYIYDEVNRVLKIPRGVSINQLEKSFNCVAQVIIIIHLIITLLNPYLLNICQEMKIRWKPLNSFLV